MSAEQKQLKLTPGQRERLQQAAAHQAKDQAERSGRFSTYAMQDRYRQMLQAVGLIEKLPIRTEEEIDRLRELARGCAVRAVEAMYRGAWSEASGLLHEAGWAMAGSESMGYFITPAGRDWARAVAPPPTAP